MLKNRLQSCRLSSGFYILKRYFVQVYKKWWILESLSPKYRLILLCSVWCMWQLWFQVQSPTEPWSYCEPTTVTLTGLVNEWMNESINLSSASPFSGGGGSSKTHNSPSLLLLQFKCWQSSFNGLHVSLKLLCDIYQLCTLTWSNWWQSLNPFAQHANKQSKLNEICYFWTAVTLARSKCSFLGTVIFCDSAPLF